MAYPLRAKFYAKMADKPLTAQPIMHFKRLEMKGWMQHPTAQTVSKSVITKALLELAMGAWILSFLACSRSADHYRIAIIPRLNSDAQWLTLHVGISEEAERRHADVFWHGPSDERDLQGQIRLLEEAVNNGSRGIIVHPSAFVAEDHAISIALRKNIPVVILGAQIGLPPNPHLHYILEDTQTEGQLVAERLAATVGEGEMAIVGLQPDVPGNRERSDSLEHALIAYAPHILVYNRLSEAERGGLSEEATLAMIRERPELRAIVALNDRASAIAAAAILTAGAHRRVRLITYGQSLNTFLLLRSGLIDSILVQPLREIGAQSIDVVMNDNLKQPIPDRRFQPILVSTANIDSEAVQQALLMHRTPPW